MTNELFIPCRHPYMRPQLSDDEHTAILVVGRGANRMQFQIPAKILQTHLKYPHNVTFTSLPNGNPTAYKLLLEFLTHGHLPIIEANPIDHIDLFTLTTGTLPLQPFRNHVLDSFLHHITTSPSSSSSSSSIPYHLIPKLYAATAPHSSLRHLLVDVVINTGSAADVAAWNAAARLPREFLTDCWDLAAKQGIQPCANAQPEAGAWVREKAARFCSEDHVHDGVGEAIVRFDGAQGMMELERREHARVLRCMEEEAEQRMRCFLSWRHTRVRY